MKESKEIKKAKKGIVDVSCDTGILIDKPIRISSDSLDAFIETVEIESLWSLASNSKNRILKEKARERLIDQIINDDNIKAMLEKIGQDEEEYELENPPERSFILRKVF